MSRDFPLDRDRLRSRISNFRRALNKELAESGYVNDDSGKRFLLGPMYQLMGRLDEALDFYDWCSEHFPDDSGHPWQFLCWSLALCQSGRFSEACDKLFQTIFQNLYLLPTLLDRDVVPYGYRHFSDSERFDYALTTPLELMALWNQPARDWVGRFLDHPEVVAEVDRFIQLERELEGVDELSARKLLVGELFKIRRGGAPVVVEPVVRPEVIVIVKGEAAKAKGPGVGKRAKKMKGRRRV